MKTGRSVKVDITKSNFIIFCAQIASKYNSEVSNFCKQLYKIKCKIPTTPADIEEFNWMFANLIG